MRPVNSVNDRSYYITARFDRREELRVLREQLQDAVPGAFVTSRWLNGYQDQGGAEQTHVVSAHDMVMDPQRYWRWGACDLSDIRRAHVIISILGPVGGTGGRHVEYGYALALGKRLVLIGEPENVFHLHPHVESYGSWEEFLSEETRNLSF